MKILEQYILRRVVLMFLTALLPVLAIIWTTQVLQRINLVTDSGQSVGSFMVLATMILPTIVATVLPFALEERAARAAMVSWLGRLWFAPNGLVDYARKGRALNGIWATAPYLHNGSVPTLYDLLLPAADRPKKFRVGSRELDVKKVGLKQGESV